MKFTASSDLCFRQINLFVVFIVHETVFIAFLVEILHFLFAQIGRFKVIDGTEGAFELVAVDHVFELGAVQSLSLARFDKIKFGNDVGFVVDF